MNRRSFLGLSSLAVAGMVLDPERALWVPGQKTIIDLGPGSHVMYGGWIAQMVDRAIAQYDADMERFLFTRVDGQMFGGTIAATPKQWRDPAWPAISEDLTQRAIRDLDRVARHARAVRRSGYRAV